MIDPIYTLIMLLAVVACGLMLRHSQRDLTINRGDRLLVRIAAFCGAMIGAKLPFVLLGEAVGYGGWLANGKTILTGMAGGYLAVEVVKWLLQIETKTGDTFAAPVAVAVAIGRLGCFRAGCCYGEPTDLPWGVVFPTIDSLPRHPTQIYESLFHVGAAALLLGCAQQGWFRHNLLKLYLMTYAAYRFATEWLRPEPPFALGLTAYQFASAAIVIVMAMLWHRDATPIRPLRSVREGTSRNTHKTA